MLTLGLAIAISSYSNFSFVIMLNQHYLGIHACVMRLEIAGKVQCEVGWRGGGKDNLCLSPKVCI